MSLLALAAACGSGGGDESSSSPSYPPASGSDVPASREAAARFLTQASFGPTEASIDRVMALGYSNWIDDQLDNRARTSHLTNWRGAEAVAKAASDAYSAGQDGTINSFWSAAIAGDDQLRQRVAFALSQIFVISMQNDSVGGDPAATAHYYDMLADKGLGSYRELLEAVSLHPQMGRYLTSLGNRKEDTRTGRVPDENYAREIMQLFSIGLFELNEDGTQRLVSGAPVETYTPADIAGLARVFTGWSWACPVAPTATSTTCFGSGSVTVNGTAQSYPDRSMRPMIGYPVYHEAGAKTFLGTTIPVQSTANPNESLRIALDRLAGHPNVGPFIGKQLIQRLVTSNPSTTYVRDVARAFSNSNGNLRTVVKAILTHPEARTVTATSGKVREPVLRMSAFLRAFPFNSISGSYLVGNTDNPNSSLGQSALRAPSVFNFYRPGYVPPGSNTALANLVGPELQMVEETTAAGYVNYMLSAVQNGAGPTTNPYSRVSLGRRDLVADFTAELALVDKPSAAAPSDLVEHLNRKLMYGSMPADLKTEIQTAVASITIPAATSTNQTTVANARRNRLNAALFLTLVSPEFMVQK